MEVSSVEQISSAVPSEFGLSQNFVNPFIPAATIYFDEPQAGKVQLKIFDALRNEVASLVSEHLEPRGYSVRWDASGLASGVCFWRMVSGSFVGTKKMLLVK
jgi:hypothetical protein